jgi:ATP phosphoribosyltransferase
MPQPASSRQDIRLALPSKGRLQTATLDFLSQCGFDVKQSATRGYVGSISNLPNVTVIFQRPRDIVISVANGGVDFGITGFDVVQEAGVASQVHFLHDALGFGACKLVVAVPEKWEARTMSDLAHMAADWATAGKPLRVATVFPHITHNFLQRHNIPNCQIVEAEGSLEVLPEINAADMIADIVETGSTLQQNRLRALEDGLMLTTQASLIANHIAIQRDDVRQVAVTMLEYIEAHLRAEKFLMVIANMRGTSAEDVAHKLHTQTTLGGLQGPTIAPIYANSNTPKDSGWFGITLMVKRNELTGAIDQLRKVGGSGVIVTPVAYVFEEQPERVAALKGMTSGE